MCRSGGLLPAPEMPSHERGPMNSILEILYAILREETSSTGEKLGARVDYNAKNGIMTTVRQNQK
jgi:hypothetical protein